MTIKHEATTQNLPIHPVHGSGWDFRGLTKLEHFTIILAHANIMSGSHLEPEQIVAQAEEYFKLLDYERRQKVKKSEREEY